MCLQSLDSLLNRFQLCEDENKSQNIYTVYAFFFKSQINTNAVKYERKERVQGYIYFMHVWRYCGRVHPSTKIYGSVKQVVSKNFKAVNYWFTLAEMYTSIKQSI